MQATGLDVDGLSVGVAERFLAERRGQGYASRISPRGLRPLLDYLQALGVLSGGAAVEATEVDRLVAEFCGYLLGERGLVTGSVQLYARIARRFLAERSEPLGDDLARLSGAEINAFVLREARRVTPRGRRRRWCARYERCCGSCMCRAGSRRRWRAGCRRCRNAERICRADFRPGRSRCWLRAVIAQRRSGAGITRS